MPMTTDESARAAMAGNRPWVARKDDRRIAQLAEVAAGNEQRKREREQARGDFTGLIAENHRLREALESASVCFERIRLRLIDNLTEPESVAFWAAVEGRNAARAALERTP